MIKPMQWRTVLLMTMFFSCNKCLGLLSPPVPISDNTCGREAKMNFTNRATYVFFNANAGSAQATNIETARQLLEEQLDVKLIKLNPKAPIQHCRKVLQGFPQRNSSSDILSPVVVAAGGDGTVGIVAKAVLAAQTDKNHLIPLGVLPMGTANAFAAALQIPTGLEEACQVLMRGNTRKIDAAKATPGDTMTLLAGLGFEANMVKTAQGRFKKWFGKLAYIWGGAKQVVAPKIFSSRLRIFLNEKDEPLQVNVDSHAITVAVVAPPGSISAQGSGNVVEDDGLLDVTIQTSDTVMGTLDGMMHLLGAALVNRPAETENVLRFRAKRIEIKTKSRQAIVVDGELLRRRKRFEFEVLPQALQVIVPPTPPSPQ